ncbi:MAG: hypothetical protein Q8K60_01410 [Parachlamydiaceae bacterium]|nr:hypothetical protein [Parachlamydiaceae bacterium]
MKQITIFFTVVFSLFFALHAGENEIENEQINEQIEQVEQVTLSTIKGIEISEFGFQVNANQWGIETERDMSVMKTTIFKHNDKMLEAKVSNLKLKAPYEPYKQALLVGLKNGTLSSELAVEQDMTVNGIPVKFWQVNAVYKNGVSSVTLALIYTGEKEVVQIFITAEESEFPALENQMRDFLFGFVRL